MQPFQERRESIGTTGLIFGTADGVFELMLLQLAREHGTAFVLVTHDEALAARCGRHLRLVLGRLSEAEDLFTATGESMATTG